MRKKWKILAEQGAAFMSVISSSPDLLKGVNPERIANFKKLLVQHWQITVKHVQSDKVSWTVLPLPSPAWAAKVSRMHLAEKQVSILWDAIFKAVRVDVENPVEAWKKHDETLHEKVNYLNEKRYQKLHYTAPGTDLTIELPEKHLWVGAGSVNEKGMNLWPTCRQKKCSLFHYKTGVNGTVASTKPLSYGGNIIDRFSDYV